MEKIPHPFLNLFKHCISELQLQKKPKFDYKWKMEDTESKLKDHPDVQDFLKSQQIQMDFSNKFTNKKIYFKINEYYRITDNIPRILK